MSLTAEHAGGRMRAWFAICDTIGGMTAALAVSSALYQRTHTGRGQFVDVAMLDAALAFIPGPVSEYSVAGIPQRQIGNGSVSRKPTAGRFRAGDGFLVLAVLTEKQFVALMRLIGAGFRLAHGSPGIEREPPTLGEHTDEILAEAGYTPAEIKDLRRDGV